MFQMMMGCPADVFYAQNPDPSTIGLPPLDYLDWLSDNDDFVTLDDNDAKVEDASTDDLVLRGGIAHSKEALRVVTSSAWRSGENARDHAKHVGRWPPHT